jgi:hypothetical protein
LLLLLIKNIISNENSLGCITMAKFLVDFKVLDNDAITTREMDSNDETVSLYYDCDFSTNTKNFSGLFKDNAIKRRIYPIKKC